MSQLNYFFTSLKKSLFESKYYKEIASTGFGSAFKYLWFLLFILVLLKGIVFGGQYIKNRSHIQPGVNKFMIYAQNFYPKNLELKIRKGQLSTNVKEPYFFDLGKNEWPSDKRHLLIIDTRGSIENYPNYNSYVLATRNAVVYPSKSDRNGIGETKVFYFRGLRQDVTLNKNTYNNLLNVARPYTNKATSLVDYVFLILFFLFIVFGPLLWVGGVLFGLLFLVFFVWIINLLFKKGYSFGSLFKMGMHAVTWPIIVSEVLSYSRFPFPKFYSLIFLIWMFIILFSQDKKVSRKAPVKKRG